MAMQGFFDSISTIMRDERSQYHLTLGKAIEKLEGLSADTPLEFNLGGLHSYRGFYSDLAFRRVGNLLFVRDVLAECKSALGQTFEGYKGGDFFMGPDTPLWISDYGEASGIAILGFDSTDTSLSFLTKDTYDD